MDATQAQRLKRIRGLSRLMDEAIRIPGTKYRIGLDGLAGLVPGIGDVVGAAFSAYLIQQASQMGVPRHLLRRMAINVALDLAVGAVPVLGDVFDFAWKANVRNLALLDRHFGTADTIETTAVPAGEGGRAAVRS